MTEADLVILLTLRTFSNSSVHFVPLWIADLLLFTPALALCCHIFGALLLLEHICKIQGNAVLNY